MISHVDGFFKIDPIYLRLPQFAGMTLMEIRKWLAIMEEREFNAWIREYQAKLAKERAEDAAYLETSKDTIDPESIVVIDDGRWISKLRISDDGFITEKDINESSKVFRLKLSIGNKRVYSSLKKRDILFSTLYL